MVSPEFWTAQHTSVRTLCCLLGTILLCVHICETQARTRLLLLNKRKSQSFRYIIGINNNITLFLYELSAISIAVSQSRLHKIRGIRVTPFYITTFAELDGIPPCCFPYNSTLPDRVPPRSTVFAFYLHPGDDETAWEGIMTTKVRHSVQTNLNFN